jgi:RimJ/RimL family protein N-acetyltransferase
MVGALVRWALRQPGVARVVAETEWANPASVRVLSKAGFAPTGTSTEEGGALFEFVGSACPAEPEAPADRPRD